MKAIAGWLLAMLVVAACASSAPPPRYASAVPPPVPTAPNEQQQAPHGMAGPLSAQGPFQPNANLYVCHMGLSNRPATTRDQRIVDYAPMIVVNGVVLAAAPANDVCLSSGFGQRYGRSHKGIDLFVSPAGMVYSAAPGKVREVSWQRGYGQQVVIDHGRGVYTRYAHLDHFASGLREGMKIGFGQPLGRMGQTGNASAPHLHFEVLTGRYNNPKRSFGLQAHNPLAFPRWAGLDTNS